MQALVLRVLKRVAMGLVLAVASAQPVRAAQPPAGAEAERELIDKYCLTCHNFDRNAGGLSLLLLDPAAVNVQSAIAHPDTAKLIRGLMVARHLPVPPEGRTLASICVTSLCK
jgi:hypothetical protein